MNKTAFDLEENDALKDALQTVTSTVKDWQQLVRDSQLLDCLRAAGVDNWEGYEHAMEIYREWFPDEELK